MQPIHYFLLSTVAAIFTIIFKMIAWKVTGSVGLLSDALESLVNLAAALFGLWMVMIARLPPDEDHPLGHSKAEYFSSAFEGVLILCAALGILYAAIERFLAPQPVESIGVGAIYSIMSTLINLAVAITLKRAALRFRSVALEADAKHLMTDVWTSCGVLIGLGLVYLSDIQWLDPVIALFIGGHILLEGTKLLHISALGLLDTALPSSDIQAIERTLQELLYPQGIQFQNVRTRRAGAISFVYVHVLFPHHWNIVEVHDVLDQIENTIEKKMQGVRVMTHPEPL